jgi:hypothetical protein
MKTPASVEGGRGSKKSVREATSNACPLPFTIVELEAVSYGSKRAIGKIEIAGLGIIDVEYFSAPGKPPFAETLSIRNRYTGRYERVVDLDETFAEELRDAIECRLTAADDGAV